MSDRSGVASVELVELDIAAVFLRAGGEGAWAEAGRRKESGGEINGRGAGLPGTRVAPGRTNYTAMSAHPTP